MTDIDKILANMAQVSDKRKGDLKRTYNSIMKQKESEGLVGIVDPKTLEKICLLGVCKKYEIPTSAAEPVEEFEPEPEPFISDYARDIIKTQTALNVMLKTGLDESEIGDLIDRKRDELKGLITAEGALLIISKELGVDVVDNKIPKESTKKPKKATKTNKVTKMSDDWKDIFSTTIDPDDMEFDDGEGDFEELPNFKPMINVRYNMKLRYPKETPYCHEGIGRNDKEYKSYAVKITLTSKGDLDETHAEGEGYTFWMSAAMKGEKPKLFDYFAKFWETIGAGPDDREFAFLKTQKISKKGRNYNIFEFKEI